MTHTLAPRTFPSAQAASAALAAEIAALIRSRAADDRTVVLGLATGSTPIRLYAELVRLHREESLSFANVITFNLDEYLGITRDHPVPHLLEPGPRDLQHDDVVVYHENLQRARQWVPFSTSAELIRRDDTPGPSVEDVRRLNVARLHWFQGLVFWG